jgi:translation elongation factor EF-G
LEFVNDIKGGAIPKEFISSVKKGFEEAMKNGMLPGYPLESMRLRLFVGSIHDEDSSAQGFELVASLGFKQAAKKASPKLLEPLMRVNILTPEEYTGSSHWRPETTHYGSSFIDFDDPHRLRQKQTRVVASVFTHSINIFL